MTVGGAASGGGRWTRRRLLGVGGALAAGIAASGSGRAAPLLGGGALQPSPQASTPIRAIYMNPLVSSTAADFFDLVDLIEATELNALVVDVKEEGVYYDTAVPLYRESGAIDQWLDVEGLLRTLQGSGVYAIARLVVFKDNFVAAARPDLAILDRTTGEPWRDDGGQAWLNPFKAEVWEAAIALAEELGRLGFDEIQLDYVRFPSDGDLSLLDYGRPVDDAQRIETITGFVRFAGERLRPLGVATAADVFGYTLLLDDIGIGQNAGRIGEVADVVCPMVYPSHFPLDSIAVPGHPNDFPAETIAISMAAGSERVPPAKLRPWLQDFTLPGMTAYGPAEVRAQIDAAEAAGTSGWMIWDPDNAYSRAAFRPAG